jgi:hypothetical protein
VSPAEQVAHLASRIVREDVASSVINGRDHGTPEAGPLLNVIEHLIDTLVDKVAHECADRRLHPKICDPLEDRIRHVLRLPKLDQADTTSSIAQIPADRARDAFARSVCESSRGRSRSREFRSAHNALRLPSSD